MIPLNGYLAKKSRDFQKRIMKEKDSRIKLMNEVSLPTLLFPLILLLLFSRCLTVVSSIHPLLFVLLRFSLSFPLTLFSSLRCVY